MYIIPFSIDGLNTIKKYILHSFLFSLNATRSLSDQRQSTYTAYGQTDIFAKCTTMFLFIILII